MRLQGVELSIVELFLRETVTTSALTHDRRPVLYVRIVTDGGEGWGECGALETGDGVDAPLAEVWQTLVERAVPRIFSAAAARGGELPVPSVLARIVGDDAPARMAGAAVEMATLDLELRTAGRSLAAWLGTTRDVVEAGAVVGIPDDRDLGVLLAAVASAHETGARRVRMKIAPGWDATPVQAVRETFPDLALQVDANGAYRNGSDDDADASRLRLLDPWHLVCIEQPLPPTDLVALARLAAELETPVALDESLSTPRRLRDALRYGACEVACLKPARLGGLAAARRAAELCAEAGVPAFVGGFFETGLGRSANAGVAGLAGCTLPGDLSRPASYLDVDPCGYPEVTDGQLAVPSLPGIGPPPDPDVLSARSVARAWFPVDGEPEDGAGPGPA